MIGLIIDIILALILIFSFLGGLREGAVKACAGLLVLVIALPLAGMLSPCFIEWWALLIPNLIWRVLLSLLLSLGIITVVLHLIFWFPRHLLDKAWPGGLLKGMLGGVIGLIDAMLGFTLITILLSLYPVFPWLPGILGSSIILNWLNSTFGGFIMTLLNPPSIAATNISFYVELWVAGAGR